MMNDYQLFSTLSGMFLLLGIIFAFAALFIFVQAGIKDYFMLMHHNFEKDHSGNTGVLDNQTYEEEPVEQHFVKNPSELLHEPEIMEKEELAVPLAEKQEDNEIVNDEMPAADEEDDGSGVTDDLSKKKTNEETDEDEEDYGLTGVLSDVDAPTGVLSPGNEQTSLLSQSVRTRDKEKEKSKALWADPVQNVSMKETCCIICVHTDKNIEP